MIDKFRSFFSRAKPSNFHIHTSALELEKTRLEGSSQLLRQTTYDVSVAAVNAATALEQRLKDSENRFFSTIDTIDDLVIVKDGDGRWKTLNKVGQDLFDWHNNEYHGKTDLELCEMYPAFKETLLKCIETDEAAWNLKKSNRVEEYIVSNNCTRVLDVIKTPVFDKADNRKELIIVGRDMTDIIEKQRRNRACFHAMNSASDGIVIIDSKARLIFSNDEFNRKFGIENYTDVLNKKMIDVLPWLNRYDSVWQKARENQSIRIVTEEAGEILVMPMMNGLPKPIYFICTFKK